MRTRTCPQCNNTIEYKSYGGWHTANKNKSICKLCVSINSGFIEKYATKGKNIGVNNPFYGKKHSDVVKTKISKANKGRIVSEDVKKKISKNNKRPMTGRSVYSVWLGKYGKEEANRLDEIRRRKNSESSLGMKNPMYGKPTPMGSGVGWKGWYKGFFFRSLRELSYIIYLEQNNIPWISAETNEFRIKYQYLGSERTYKPDFLINNKILIECKPIKLINSPLVIAKQIAAEKFAKDNGLEYKIVDVEIIPPSIIQQYIENGLIRFMDKYQEKFNQYAINYCKRA